ncbi:LysR family transcriptional regulator [Niallia circulans]|jgi:LysR family transcriptional regulator, transcriptional activator of the cysJI operon|uniref:LysR family transcriptional regulator n=1 Tax=Niallia circulans TaxID=1397 RepID=A0A268FAS7_NIACI|nr:LysR family transcriptional regulator [Niallia circulans]AYV68997.1 LysR family transcriptional regulator [Niallia circulans]AYV72611.1 LysR family transcriptional regulator [Niallia circulans]PAD82484.1 LysR family transcriptional regulator [Niallia circulans]
MQYEALKTFVTLVEVKNFTKTAEMLLMSQPSVSLHIKNLEKEFQTKLLERSPKYLKVTPTGQMLYDCAIQMIRLYDQTRQHILEHHHAIKGELKIGASFTIGEYILPALLLDLQREHSELQIQATIGNTEEIVQAVRLYEVDIGLIEGQTNDKELQVVPFMEDELFIVASVHHPLATQESISISELHDQTWITRELGSGTREYLDHVIRSNGLRAESFLTISSNQGIKETLINGNGLSLLSKSVIERDVKNGNLSIIPITNARFTRRLSYLFAPIMKEKQNVITFIETLKKTFPYTE